MNGGDRISVTVTDTTLRTMGRTYRFIMSADTKQEAGTWAAYGDKKAPHVITALTDRDVILYVSPGNVVHQCLNMTALYESDI